MKKTESGIFLEIRKSYHKKLCKNILGDRGGDKGLSVADSDNKSSKKIAAIMAEKMGFPLCKKPPKGQTAGTKFGLYTMEFVRDAFGLLDHLRPGDWVFSATGGGGVAKFDQYQHLFDLQKVLDENPKIKAAFDSDYLVVPDVIVARNPVSDDEINIKQKILSEAEQTARLTSFRALNYRDTEPVPILHASISCKWTMRSDRAQNTRTEALNLMRNRKGQLPHIVAVVFEPLPTRIASIALGTGDIDCTYHGALYELIEAVAEGGLTDQAEMLNTLIEGKRLRDISDLPLDLAT
jgi:hypothetical protein